MSFASSNRTTIRRVAETSIGITPSSPSLIDVRYTGESLNYNIETTQSKEIRSDRMLSDLIQTQSDASGSLEFELSANTFDDFIEATMSSEWDSDVIKNGLDLRSFTLQKHIQDATIPTFINFTGSCVNTMGLNFAVGSPLTGSFGFMSLTAAVTDSQFGDATIVEPTTTDILNAVTNVVAIEENGVKSENEFKSITMDLNNNIRAQDAIGSLSHIGLVLGQVALTGNISIYFENKSMLDRFISNTAFSISFKVEDVVGNSYTFYIPKAKFQSGTVVSGGLDTDIMFEGTWTALLDPVESTMFKITRVVV